MKNIIELPEYIGINDHIIKLEKDKRLSFGLIYNLRPIELETLKIYVKTILANRLILLFKFFARAFIFFNQEPNSSFCFYINYQSFINLIIKNWYFLFLIEKLLNWLG